jgi:trimeric autotransporter adhesin
MKNFTLIKSVSCLLMFLAIPFGVIAQNQLISEMLTIEHTTEATNTGNLVWSSDGRPFINSEIDLNIALNAATITTTTEVVKRKWQFVETGGNVGIVRVSIPTASFINGFPTFGPSDACVMIVADNASFTSGRKIIYMSTLGANQSCLYDFNGTKFISFGLAHQKVNSSHITLDGSDDCIKVDNINELTSAFTIMTWIRPNGANTLGNDRTIISKKADASSGYQLVLQTNNKIRMEWSVAGTTYSAISATSIPNLKWHNIAVTYGSNTLAIYIDGLLDTATTITTAPVASVSDFSIGARYQDTNTINNFFKGDIDEVRMWDKVITINQIRFMMNQEILQDGSGIKGATLSSPLTKNDIGNLNWNNLFAYYSMNSYIGNHLDDDSQNNNRGILVATNNISINPQTAPLPYESTTNGLWSETATWRNGATQDLPNDLSIIDNVTPINWNIVKTNHNINSTGNKTLLGLMVNNNTLSATNDSKITVSHYLKLNGKIDLVGKSQLIQTLNSDLDATSSGTLERDQQGQANMYNYNYWSSPVGAINATTNNNSYTVATIMKDGTTTTPQNINWIGGYNGSPTTPISLCNYWIYKFQNSTGTYANWQALGSSGTLNPGQGYTLKGSGATTLNQNYTFVGKPNNGLITSPIGPNNLNLCGNPYASALDADAFIAANSASITGTLYFWEHSNTNSSHNLVAYQGSYAQRNRVGGTPGISYSTNLNSNIKEPKRYIPVGQGFFVSGSAAGGTITFNNNQRAFFKEGNASLSNTLLRNNSSILSTDHFNNNAEDSEPELTSYKKLRLGFDDRNGYHRQVLMGFMDQDATSGIDVGYDAIHLDNQPNDMYFLNGTTKINIAGEGFFDVNSIYPIGVKIDALGTVTFKLDQTENINDSEFDAFIYDNVTNVYHNISDGNFSLELPQGIFDNRFTLRFQNLSLGNPNFNLNDGIIVAYTSADDMLNIKNNLTDVIVEKVTLYNLLGQSISNWDVADEDQQNIQLPIQNLSAGTYIVKVITDKGESSKKIILN